ncbi:MAG: class IV adenylate cyclase [Anaerolineales bacterium]|nr:class IV adenylate cyclase [Anaerolineales bacterium]
MEDQEIEVKFYVQNISRVEQRLIALGAELSQPRTLETNLRFDTPQGDLARSFQVLRLRQDTAARLTYKGPAHGDDGVRVRQEIEFIVSDFGAAQRLLEALGYQIGMIYEKYRAQYELPGLHIALDEMPYGNFVEIEGPDSTTIQALSAKLGLNWRASVQASYTMLFQNLQTEHKLPFRDLSFDNFQNLLVTDEMLHVVPADMV